MKFKFSFKVHSDILSNGTRYITEMPGLVKVKAAYNTLGFLFEYEGSYAWKYLPISALVAGWNEISLDGDNTKIRLTANGHYFTLIDESTSYSITTVTSSYGHYWSTVSIPPLSTADSWEINTVYTENGGGSSSSSIIGLGGAYNQDYTNPILIYQSGYLKALLGSSGSSWDINTSNSSLSLQTGHTYYFKFGFTGTTYYIDYNEASWEDNFTNVFSLQSSTKVHCNTPLCFLGSSSFPYSAYANGPMLLTDTKVFINNETWFDGSTAVLGVDYINNGCEFTRTEYYPTGKYPNIHTGTLTNYQSWLYLKDIQALKLND